MPFKVFTNGSILPDSDVNDYLMEQTIISCTSGTRPSAPNDGMMTYETDTKRNSKYNLALTAWESFAMSRTSFTPTLGATTTPPGMGTGAIRLGWYTIVPGPSVTYEWYIKIGTSPSAGNGTYTITLPITAASPFGASAHSAVGTILTADASSAGVFKTGTCFIDGGDLTTVRMIGDGSILINQTNPWVIAVNDYFSGQITYPI